MSAIRLKSLRVMLWSPCWDVVMHGTGSPCPRTRRPQTRPRKLCNTALAMLLRTQQEKTLDRSSGVPTRIRTHRAENECPEIAARMSCGCPAKAAPVAGHNGNETPPATKAGNVRAQRRREGGQMPERTAEDGRGSFGGLDRDCGEYYFTILDKG